MDGSTPLGSKCTAGCTPTDAMTAQKTGCDSDGNDGSDSDGNAPCEQACEDEFPQCINYQSSRIEGGCVAVYDQCSESQIREPPRLYFFFR